jgi:hypothetical protein
MANAIIFTDRAPRSNLEAKADYNPAYLSFPAGAYKLASVLREQGLSVIVVPNCLNLTFEGVKSIITNNSKGLLWVGISSTLMFIRSDRFPKYRQEWHTSTENTMSVEPFSGKIDARVSTTEMAWGENELNAMAEWSSVPVLVGGSWITHMKNGNFENLHNNVILVRNYAESFIQEFTNNRLLGKSEFKAVDNIPYDNNGFKESTIVWDKKDVIAPTDWLPLEVARGCAFACAYCTFPHRGKFDQFKDPHILREELIRNYEHFGTTNYILVDDLYNDSKKKVRDLYDKVWSNLPFKPEWSSYMRLDMFWHDPESIEIVKASGARMGSFGIETLDDRAGKAVGKGLGRKRIIETLEKIKQSWGNDILVQANLIAGLPYETRESIRETLEWSLSTDLLFTASWYPMWITPPSHFEIVEETEVSKISKNTDKWEVRWLAETNWINSAGLTFEECDDIAFEFIKRCNRHGLTSRATFTFVDYADLRTAGLSHQDILNVKSGIDREIVKDALIKVGKRTEQRLEKILTYKDIG